MCRIDPVSTSGLGTGQYESLKLYMCNRKIEDNQTTLTTVWRSGIWYKAQYDVHTYSNFYNDDDIIFEWHFML